MKPQKERNLKGILLSERSQAEKAMCCVSPADDILEKTKPGREEKGQWLPGAGRQEERCPDGTQGALKVVKRFCMTP